MDNKLHNIDEIFAKTLGDHSIDPPAYVWDNIKGQLDAASGKRRIRIGWITGTASAIIFSFIGGYFIANSSSSNADKGISEKITNTHEVQIDVNHFWDLRQVVIGETTSGGQTFTATIPGGSNDNTSNVGQNNLNYNGNSNNNYGNRNTNDNHNGYFGTHSKEDFQDNRKTPNSNNQQHNPNVPAENQGSGEDVKKINAVTSDVNGPVETQIGARTGSTNVAANDNTNEVIIDNPNSTNTNVVTTTNTDGNTNNATIEENRTETLNPNDPSIAPTPISFTILPYFSPTYTFRNSSMRSTEGIQNAFDGAGGNSKFVEDVNFSYSTGVLVGYNFTPRLTVFIGASYNSFSNTTTRENIHSKSFDQLPQGDSTLAITSAGELGGLSIVPTQGTPETPTYIEQDYNMNPSEIGSIKRITQTFSYVEVPVLARYRVFGPKVGLIFTGGLSTGFIVQNDVMVESNTETKRFGETNQIRNFNMNAIFGIGLEARILPFMYLNIEPTFKYSFLNWSMDERFQMNPFSLGLNTGLAFKF